MAAALGADVTYIGLRPIRLDVHGLPQGGLCAELELQDKPEGETIMKNAILLAALVAAVALGACRREEAPPPMKLGADVPAASVTK